MKLDCKPSVLKFLEHLAKGAPYNLKKGEPQFEFTLLSHWLNEDLAEDLLLVLNEIRLELVPKHADGMFLINAFWNELVCEVNANCKKYHRAPRALEELVDNFGDAWKKPLSRFEVAYSINNLQLGGEPIALLGVEFFAPTDDALARRELPKERIGWLNPENETISLAFVKFEAAPTANLFQAGKDQVIDALNVLRVERFAGWPKGSKLMNLLNGSFPAFA